MNFVITTDATDRLKKQRTIDCDNVEFSLTGHDQQLVLVFALEAEEELAVKRVRDAFDNEDDGDASDDPPEEGHDDEVLTAELGHRDPPAKDVLLVLVRGLL